jgi:PTS hybrid protein
MNRSVAVVIVSHSAKVAEGAADMARQMAGEEPAIAWSGGNPEGGLGTDVSAIHDAINNVWSETGVVVLADLGGAVMNAEMAIEMLGAERAGCVRLCDAPLVEGAVVAAAEASGGSSLEAVCAAALAVKR